jgi:hypothetical protein
MLYTTLALGFASSVDALRVNSSPRAQVVASTPSLSTALSTLGK